MENMEQLAELARCIEEHNTLKRQARELWRRAQAESARIAELVRAAISPDASWTELGALLSGIDDALPPAGLVAVMRSGKAPAVEESESEEGRDARPHVPTQSAGDNPRLSEGKPVPEGTPALLFQAYSVVSAHTEQEMATRDLAVALGRNPNTVGPDLCSLLREVGVERPNGGKIKARYQGNGKRLPGFTASCLQQALDAYATREVGSPNEVVS
jgi:hypothetical protein